MTSATFARPGENAPSGLIGMIGLIILVETIIANHHLDFTRFYIHDWHATGNSAREVARDRSLLCFGDSLVKFGVLPCVIQQQTGERAYNLSVCGGQAASSYFLLRRALEAHSKPSAVVVDYAPHLLSEGPRHNLRQWPELLNTREAVELGLVSRHAGFCAELALRCIFPSIKDREEIRSGVLAALQGKAFSRRDDVLAHRHAWEKNLGAEVHPDRPSYQGEVDLHNPAYFPRKWSCHRVNEYYIHRLLDLAASNGVQVLWLLPPVVPGFQARRDELGLEAMYTAFLDSLTKKHANLTILDGRHAGYDHSLFVDPLHLNGRGAEALSSEIASVWTTMGGERPASRRSTGLPKLRTRTTGFFKAGDAARGLALRLPSKGRGR